MILLKHKLTIRVGNCPIKGGKTADRYFQFNVPIIDSLKVRKPSMILETIETNLYVSLFERKIHTKQVFPNKKVGGDNSMESNTQYFFQRLKKATMDRDIAKVELMTNALQKNVANPKFGTRFTLLYVLPVRLVSMNGVDWEWVIDYDIAHTITNRDENLIPSCEVEEQEIGCEFVSVVENTVDDSIFAVPVTDVTGISEQEKAIRDELRVLIEERNRLKAECETIEQSIEEV